MQLNLTKRSTSQTAYVTDKGGEGSLSALAEPFCPYMGHSMEENQQKHLWGITNKSGGYQPKQQWTEIDASEENQHRKQTIPLAGVTGVDVQQTTMFIIAILHLNTFSLRGNAINTCLRFRLPVMTS